MKAAPILAGALLLFLMMRKADAAPKWTEYEANPLPPEQLPESIPASPQTEAPPGTMWNWTPYAGWHLREIP